MTDFNETTLCNIKDVVDTVLTTLTKDGVYFAGRHKVFLVKEKHVGEDQALGIVGTIVKERVEIVPVPVIDLRTQFRTIDGQVMKMGEASFSNLSQNYTREQIEGADYIEIDGSAYKLIRSEEHTSELQSH